MTKDLVKETLHDALYVTGKGRDRPGLVAAAGRRVDGPAVGARGPRGRHGDRGQLLPAQRVRAGKLRDLRGSVVEVHCACPAEVAVARYNARSRHEVHVVKEVTLTEMEKYDRPVGVGPLITVDTTAPVDVATVAAEVRRLHGRIEPSR